MGETQTNEAQGTHSLREQVDVNEFDLLQRLAKEGGPFELFQHIKGSLNRWEKEQVKFAITGRSSTGKSTFINTIRKLKPGDDGFAKTGSGNTTITPTLYMHPTNDQIAFYDLPCYSTTKFKKENYINEMKISDYEFFLIFFDNVLGEDDVWLVGELRKLKKPFSLVRSKIDADIESAICNGKDQEMIIPEITREIRDALNANPELKYAKKIFLISSRKPDWGKMADLLRYVEDNIGGLKAQALLFSLESVTKEIVEIKYKLFKARMSNIILFASGMAGLAVANNTSWLENEVHLYLRLFGINQAGVNSLRKFNPSELKCRSLLEPSFNMETFVATRMGRYSSPLTTPIIDNFILSFVGSLLSAGVTAAFAYRFLNDVLQDIKHDAVLIYEHVLKPRTYH